MKICIIIPVYNHPETIGNLIVAIRAFDLPCVLVNDGSSEECSRLLQSIAITEKSWLTLYERPNNGGKGAAVIDGLRLAIRQGYTHALQLDADGQHCVEDIGRFIHVTQNHSNKLILGQPLFDRSIPKIRLYGRKITCFWIWVNTLSFAIADGMCGFRIYPLPEVDRLMKRTKLGQRMDFDIDIAVRLYWQGVDVLNIYTRVEYPKDGLSHFRMIHDNLLISLKHTQLFFGMLRRSPGLVWRHFR